MVRGLVLPREGNWGRGRIWVESTRGKGSIFETGERRRLPHPAHGASNDATFAGDYRNPRASLPASSHNIVPRRTKKGIAAPASLTR